jgi:acyl dehydratase
VTESVDNLAEWGIVATRVFEAADRDAFARLSGDYNPIHVDPVKARRTQAGAPVVHAAHALLWTLEALVETSSVGPICGVKARFNRFIYDGDVVVLRVVERTTGAIKAELRVAGAKVAIVSVDLRTCLKQRTERVDPCGQIVASVRELPDELQLASMEGLRGFFPHAQPLGASRVAFPRLAARIGESRVASLAAISGLVGMVCPGLHSISSAYTVDFEEEQRASGGLSFATTEVDERFRRIVMKVSGSGLSGSVECFARPPPVQQPDMAALRGLVGPAEFAGCTALVVGGSRGLGELTAKLIAAGGGGTILTYAVGVVDAERVAAEIEAVGSPCQVTPFDARLEVEPQLRNLGVEPTHMYYFATPRIFKQRPTLFSSEVLAEFLRVYVEAFYETCRVLASRRRGRIAAFYPSSLAVEERPRDATEYAMAKAAGEVLCADMNRLMPRVRIEVRRLPRLLTDQTATMVPSETASSLDTMLPIIRAVQSLELGPGA